MDGLLATRKDFERARELVLERMQKDGVVLKRHLSVFKMWGISHEAINLAILDLSKKGIIEELYAMPNKQGQRKEYWALTIALDAGSVDLPEGTVRASKALELIG